MVFNKYFFTHRIQYLFSIIFKALPWFKSLIVPNVEVYEFHVFINRNKEKNADMELQIIAAKLQYDRASNYQNKFY